jgi:hypothetical protein
MSNYPNPDYGPLPDYPSNIGESCATPKPRWFYDGATFCNDVTINSDLAVGGLTSTSRLIVDGVEFAPAKFQGFLILAEVGAKFNSFST